MKRMTGTEALRRVDRLRASGWTTPEIAVALGLRSTDTIRKWGVSDPHPDTAAILRTLKEREVTK